ncbi:hypothetical protein ACUOFU_15715 [Microbacterium arabinogalactanolyticum]|uniref:hypothetical protein n=1 Tax=Microbacterium arabinogalactanolyticum TaxID=69365 RepID=UPI0040447F0E
MTVYYVANSIGATLAATVFHTFGGWPSVVVLTLVCMLLAVLSIASLGKLQKKQGA